MPILPRERDIFPDNLLTEPAGDESTKWWVLYTLSRREKELMRRLRAAEISHYGPLVKQQSRSPSGRLRQSYLPLLAGYVFLRGSEHERVEALRTNCISRCLPVADANQLVFDLRQIQRLIESEAPLTPEARLTPGMQVRVRSGPLLGLEGTVVERRGQRQLLIAVQFIQSGASIQISDFEVERISL
ncbi:MAG: antitermination protein NusG [Planctomycetes bacterium]|nr:antitermination protein NusG [Planctomycetota bacterium]